MRNNMTIYYLCTTLLHVM